jgi:hypothetical protein
MHNKVVPRTGRYEVCNVYPEGDRAAEVTSNMTTIDIDVTLEVYAAEME